MPVLTPRCGGDRHILHYTYDDLNDWIAKINWLTSRDARGCSAPAVPLETASRLQCAGRTLPSARPEGGLFRGADGWTVTMTSMFRSFMKYQKLNELHELRSRDTGDPDLQLGHMRDGKGQ